MTAWLTRYGPFVVGALLIGGFVHIAIVLVIPRLAQTNAVMRLGEISAVNRLEAPPTGSSRALKALPFDDPAMVTAICRFDISEQPVRLRIAAGESFLSVLIVAPTGRVMTSLTDRAATRRLLNVVLLTAEQQRQLEAQDPDDEPVQVLRLRIAEERGVAIIRALALRDQDREPLAALLSRAGCQPD